MKKCPPGKYYCTKRQKCHPIPRGYHIGARGWLEQDDDDGNGNGKKSKGGKTNGNGSSNSNGSHSGNGTGNGGGVSEATTLPRVNGQTMYVTFQWRGKYMSLQMFFPELKVPSRKDVQNAIGKVYPGATVSHYDVVLRDPTKPLLQLPEMTTPEPSQKEIDKGNRDEKSKKALASKERRLNMIKRMVLLKKQQAVRQGGGEDIVA
jgi:hypothetical protein